MLHKIEDFFFNRFLGKVLARVGVTLAGYLASGKLGASVSVDPAELTALLIGAAHALYEWVKARRTKT